MKIIQTFWTAGQDPLKHGFGWTHPEYNLMSWALSCLSLREHYDEVELYTDSVGYHILIEVLQLPYTKTHVIFDGFQCLPHHWALSKIKTYSLQTEPFLHIDGDIYLPRPLPERILNARLVAQNREIGTKYYRQMMDEGVLKFPSIKLPEYIEKGLKEDSIASYNMGFFGGTDISFIQKYCNEVFQFMKTNRMNDKGVHHAMVNCNVFFEQIIFALFADEHGQNVESLLKDMRQDKGYTFNEFCDLTHFNVLPFFHILGGHKHNIKIETLLEYTLIKYNSNLYSKILSLYPERNKRFNKKIYTENGHCLSVEQSIAMYEDWKYANIMSWENIISKTLLINAQISALKFDLHLQKENNRKLSLSINPNIQCFCLSKNWNPKAINILRLKFGLDLNTPLNKIAMLPCISGEGYKEFALTPYECDILELLSEGALTQDEILEIVKIRKNGYRINVLESIIKTYKYKIRNLIFNEILI